MKFKGNNLELVHSFGGKNFNRETVNNYLTKNGYVPCDEYLIKNSNKHVIMMYSKSAKLYKVI